MTSLALSPVRDLLMKLQIVIEATGTNPKAGSPADQEICTFLRPESIKTALAQGNRALEASADHLEALDRLIGEAQYALTPWTCARGVLEASAISTWLFDSTIDAKERVSRSLALLYSTLQEQRKFANAFKETQKVQTIDIKIEKFENIAIELGYPSVRNKKGKRTGIGQVKPNITDLVQQQFDFGNVYRMLSGVAHSDSTVISQLGFIHTGNFTPDAIITQRAVLPEIQNLLLKNAMAIHTRGVWLRIVQYGCDTAETAVILEKGFNQLGLPDTDAMRFWRSTVGQCS